MKIKIGDTIKFKSATRDGNKSVTRKVNGFWMGGDLPTVIYNGWSNFAVRLNEISELNGEDFATLNPPQ